MTKNEKEKETIKKIKMKICDVFLIFFSDVPKMLHTQLTTTTTTTSTQRVLFFWCKFKSYSRIYASFTGGQMV
jgi:hypothetical protein